MSTARHPAPENAIAEQVPLGLYVHIPWCVRKCPYCDFNSHTAREPVDQAAYVDALLRDLDHEVSGHRLPEVGSIFIGGGTPSLFDGVAIGRLLEGVGGRLTLAADAEITLEANPGTAEARRFADYRAAGVNRLSIGVQSLDDRSLSALGRIHSATDAVSALRLARAAGFDNINIDLMYGLPDQTPAAALDDLGRAIRLAPEHLSWYQLTLEPNTLFHRSPPRVPDHDVLAEIMEAGLARLASAGYRQYEISAFARDGRECGHNRNYWRFGDYLGIGAGAHGKLTLAPGVVRRRSKRRQPQAYLADATAAAVSTEHTVPVDALPVEFFLNTLRLLGGVPAELFPRRTGLSEADITVPLVRARSCGLMDADPGHYRATPLGLRFLNDLLAIFEPD